MKDIQKQLTDKLLSSNLDVYPPGLFRGKMGLSIFFFHLSKIESNPEYHAFGDKLLDQVLLNDLTPNHPIDVEGGLAGVGLGVTWLVKKQFIEADLNEILEVIDNAIYRKLAFLKDASDFSAIQLLHLTGYLYIRLKEQTDINLQILYQDLTIKILNMLYNQIDEEFLNESYSFSVYRYQLPVFLWIISKILEARFYNDRIYKMLDTLLLNILSRFPLLHSNRLFLLWSMLNLKPYLLHNQASWDKYIQLLYREISLDEIFDKEMIGRKIFINNGLSAVYILLHTISTNFPEYRIQFDPQTIYDKIRNSDAWNTLLERDYFYKIHHGFFNGFPGVQLVLSHIKTNYELKLPPPKRDKN